MGTGRLGIFAGRLFLEYELAQRLVKVLPSCCDEFQSMEYLRVVELISLRRGEKIEANAFASVIAQYQ
jgi:hypothetical protein